MKPKVIFTSNCQYGDFEKGEKGVVDGYIRGGDNVPYAVVIKEDGHFVMATLTQIKLLNANN